MKKLTNESKARFFAQHWGQQILCWESEIAKHKYMIVGYRIKNDIERYYLELTPLQNISDEHAIEAAKVFYFPYAQNIENGKKVVENIIRNNFRNDFNSCVLIYQYLQSKSYALDWFCPIENRIIPVKEQIDNGWITLKNE